MRPHRTRGRKGNEAAGPHENAASWRVRWRPTSERNRAVAGAAGGRQHVAGGDHDELTGAGPPHLEPAVANADDEFVYSDGVVGDRCWRAGRPRSRSDAG